MENAGASIDQYAGLRFFDGLYESVDLLYQDLIGKRELE